MSVEMTPVLVVIACLTQPVDAPIDPNSSFTGHENLEWVYKNSKMVCKREEIQLIDGAELKGADPQAFNTQRCMSSAIRIATEWDLSHKSGNYRVWRVACPAPIVDLKTGTIIGWKPADCGHQDIIDCEDPTEI